MKAHKDIVGGYETIIVEPKQAKQHIVMLHGYGANYEDLFPLAEYMKLSAEHQWWFVNAPQPVFGGMDGRAWFQLDYDALRQNIQLGNWTGLQAIYGPLLEKAAKDFEGFLKASQLPIDQTIFAGFSQGSMLATQLMLTAKEKAKALLIFSGTSAHQKWSELMLTKASVPVFQSHGVYDPILPIEPAQLLASQFQAANFKRFEFLTFQGGHELPAAILDASAKFVNDLS